MKLIYVIGPYRAKTEYHIAENIRRAEEMAVEVWKLGAACICPHKNSAFMGGVVPDENFLAGDLVILSKCHAVICVESWRKSEGSVKEVAMAERWGIPVFESVIMLGVWLEEQEAQQLANLAARQPKQSV